MVNGLASGFFIAILTIYFVATYDSIKDAGYKLISASRRPAFIGYTERILKNFGRYISGMVVLIFMLIYMQVEAYILTPKVMGKAVQVPGSVVLISALAGSTLFGLPGALVAIPISAGIILIIKEVFMPHKQLT